MSLHQYEASRQIEAMRRDEGEVVAGAALGLLVVHARASDPVVRDLLGDAVAAMVEARDRILAG